MVAVKNNFWFNQSTKNLEIVYSFASLYDLLTYPGLKTGKLAGIVSSARSGEIYVIADSNTLPTNGYTVHNTHHGMQAIMTKGVFPTVNDLIDDTRTYDWLELSELIEVSNVGFFEVVPESNSYYTTVTNGGVHLVDLSSRNTYTAQRLSNMPANTIGYLGGIGYITDPTAIGNNSATNDIGVNGLKEVTIPTNILNEVEKARKWAEQDFNIPVLPNQYSAKHWAITANDYAMTIGKWYGDWQPDFNYGRADRVTINGSTYAAVTSHTSAADFNTDLELGYWEIFAAKGDIGPDGNEVELSRSATHLQWRYVGETSWRNLIALDAITGPQGLPGLQGAPGIDGTNGTNGVDGREIELRVTTTQIQWRYTGQPGWTTLIALSELEGPQGLQGTPGSDGTDGSEIELQKSSTHIQWRYVGELTWINLVPLSELQGASFTINADGPFGERSDYNNEPEGFSYLATDNGNMYIRQGAAGNWSDPIPFGKGEPGTDGREIELRFQGNEMQMRYVGDTAWSVLANKTTTSFFQYQAGQISSNMVNAGASNVQTSLNLTIKAWSTITTFSNARLAGYNRSNGTLEQIAGTLYVWSIGSNTIPSLPDMELYMVPSNNINIWGPGILGRAINNLGSAVVLALGNGLEFASNTIRVLFATKADAETATNNDKAMTALRTKEQIDFRIASTAEINSATDDSKLITPLGARQSVIYHGFAGYTQNWVDVTSSRANNTVYTNNTLKPIVVGITGARGSEHNDMFQVRKVGTSNWITITRMPSDGWWGGGLTAIIPPSYQYRMIGSNYIATWAELR